MSTDSSEIQITLTFLRSQIQTVLPKNIGSYGKESMEHGGIYWIPGHLEAGTSVPIPPNGSETAKCNAHLMWLSGYGANAHVYFGTSNIAVMNANTSSSFKGQMEVPWTPGHFNRHNIITGALMQWWNLLWLQEKCGGLSVKNNIIPAEFISIIIV